MPAVVCAVDHISVVLFRAARVISFQAAAAVLRSGFNRRIGRSVGRPDLGLVYLEGGRALPVRTICLLLACRGGLRLHRFFTFCLA